MSGTDLRRSFPLLLPLLLLLVAPVSVEATLQRSLTLEQVLSRLTAPEGSWPVPWTAAERLEGVEWDAPRQAANPDGVCAGLPFQRSGRLHLVSHGPVNLELCGGEQQITLGSVSFWARTSPPVAPSRFQAAMRRQFPFQASISPIRRCVWLDGFAGFSVYAIRAPKLRSLLVAVMTDSGGTLPGSQATTYMFTHNLNPAWSCSPDERANGPM